MIAHRIRKREATNFKSLAAYVLARGSVRGDPLDWKLGAYVLDQAHAGEKVAWAHATNCQETDLGWAVKEIQATQALNKTARTDKSYHLVVSFPEGERPSREQLEDIERELCDAIGLGDHQRVAAVHQDTDNWHMHIAINRVHPKTLRAIEPRYDHFRLAEACVALEIKHDLTRTNHVINPQRALPGRAAAMEAHTGRTSFAGWVMEHAAESLIAAAEAAQTWDDLHQVAADYGLIIKPRGAGLVVTTAGNEHGRMKASAIDRSLSFQALTDRLGPYQPPGPSQGKEPIMRYTGAPRGASPSLWSQYQHERDAALAERKAAVDKLRGLHMKYFNDLNTWYRGRYAAAKAAHLNRGDRIATRRTLETEFAADMRKRKAMEAEQRKAVKAQHAIPTWEGFLANQGAHGDRAAMNVLERRIETLIRSAGQTPETGQEAGLGRS